MTEELKDKPPDAMVDVVAGLELAECRDTIEDLTRYLIFTIGVAAGLMLALHLILRREM